MTRPVSLGHQSIVLGALALHYELRRSARRTIGITVGLDGSVVVTAPRRATMKEVQQAVQKHEDWIWKQIRESEARPRPPKPPEWINGERHSFLGKVYRLKIRRGDEVGVWRSDGKLEVWVPDPENKERIRRLMEDWYREEARSLFQRRMEKLVRETPALRVSRMPSLRVRRMKRRWGTCSSEGWIMMNTHLVQLPLRLVDYVLMHELCHLRMPHHQPSYWRYLDACMPDWRKRKAELDQMTL